jgi:predicted Zn-dependent peptidase
MLELLSDMLHQSRLAAADLDMERGVVLEEIAMYEDLPEELVFDLFYSMVWPGHMLGRNILGAPQTLSALTCDDLRAHLGRLYTPRRTVISVCGKFDSEGVRAQVEELFGQDAPGDGSREAPAPAQPAPSAVFRPGVRFTHKAVEQNQIVLAFPGCSGRDPKRYHASLLSTMLGGSTSSRLFQRLREELGLVYGVDFFNVHHMEEGVSGVSLALSEKTQCKALAEVLRILREFPGSVTPQELKRAQEQAAAGMVMGLESGAARASRAACNVLLYDDLTPVEQSIAAYRAVTLDEMRAFAKELLDPASLALCVLGKVGKKAEKEMRGMAQNA